MKIQKSGRAVGVLRTLKGGGERYVSILSLEAVFRYGGVCRGSG